MQEIRRSSERGHARHGWLESYHSFSFASYYDPLHIQFGPLRVINEDRVQPGTGFGEHGHRDMEIISYVISGELAHKDSLGNGSTIRPGDVQRMSAGTGVRHSEFNPSATEPVHFLQIWIQPSAAGIEPGYEQRHFDVRARHGQLCRIVDGQGRDGALRMHQDASVYAGCFDGAETASLALAPGRQAYVHVVRGSLHAGGVELQAGDALKLRHVDSLQLRDARQAEVLVFDLPETQDVKA
ncbi:MAG: pirin family protein [Betaproteobacteria bacterium]|nr:pirin family protein [Betaproteobacteria bacterium]